MKNESAMTSREQFEAEMAKLGDVVDMRRAKNGDMGYMAWDVSLAWRMWQASRETVVVELPEEAKCRFKYPEAEAQCDGFNDALFQCRDAIESAGIKLKVE